jgi:hypothetical protein
MLSVNMEDQGSRMVMELDRVKSWRCRSRKIEGFVWDDQILVLVDVVLPRFHLPQSYPQKRYGDRDRQDPSARQGRTATAGLNSPDITRAPGRSLGFGRGEGGGAFGGGDSHTKGSNRFGILDGETADAPGRERRERNPWRDAETGFRDRDRQDRLDKAEKEGGGMSGGGRYIPVNGGFASPVIEKAGLVERRGVRGPLLRRDTAEAGERRIASIDFERGIRHVDHVFLPTLSGERDGDP